MLFQVAVDLPTLEVVRSSFMAGAHRAHCSKENRREEARAIYIGISPLSTIHHSIRLLLLLPCYVDSTWVVHGRYCIGSTHYQRTPPGEFEKIL